MKECTSPETVLTKPRVNKFASRSRAHICTYYHLEEEHRWQEAAITEAVASVGENDCTPIPPCVVEVPKQELLSYSEIQKVMKALKGHRCALDFDSGFINSELRETPQDDEGA